MKFERVAPADASCVCACQRATDPSLTAGESARTLNPCGLHAVWRDQQIAAAIPLLAAATSFEFGAFMAIRIVPAMEGRPEIWRVRRGYFDVLPLVGDPSHRVDLSREEAITVARDLAAKEGAR